MGVRNMTKKEGEDLDDLPLFLCANPYAKMDAETLFLSVF